MEILVVFLTTEIIEIAAVVVAFGIIVTASNHLAKIFQKIKLPLITGFIIVGILTGPYLLKMLPGNLHRLEFVNDVSLAFIALAAGVEIYLKEIRDKVRDISIMTASQFFITFIFGFFIVYFISDYIPFLKNTGEDTRIAISLLTATIFIARSPASAIAVINELRAKGPFTKIALGVTILKDIFVIILFAVTFSVADVLVTGREFNLFEIFNVLVGIVLSILLGLLYGKIFELNFKKSKNEYLDFVIILVLGWSMFLLSNYASSLLQRFFHLSVHFEALLIGMVAGFYVTNNTKYRINLEKLTYRFGHYVYAAFFTLIGATLSLDILLKYWPVALVFFGIRLFGIIFASVTGSMILKQSRKETLLSWTPYVTQAGVSLGLITLVSSHFTGFGVEFEAILIAVIIVNQFVGPPLLKWAIVNVKEAHTKSNDYKYDFHKDVFIIGVGGKAVMLAKTLKREGYFVQIITDKKGIDISNCQVKINKVKKIDFQTLKELNMKSADSVVVMRKEDVAYELCEMIYEGFGTPNVIVVLETRKNVQRFKNLGVIVVAPMAALIALLEHLVRSPHATSILLGMQENHETEEIEVLADDVHGMSIKDLRLPLGTLIVSITRNNQIMMPGGYTRLRKHDTVALVGSQEQIDLVRTKLQY